MPRLTCSVTQGGADAYAIASTQTGLAGGTGRTAYRIDRMLFEVNRVAQAAAGNVELALIAATKAAMPNISDEAVLHKVKYLTEFNTSGASAAQGVLQFEPGGEGLLIVEDAIFLAIDSNATGVVNTGIVVVEFTPVTISVEDRLTLLLNRNSQ